MRQDDTVNWKVDEAVKDTIMKESDAKAEPEENAAKGTVFPFDKKAKKSPCENDVLIKGISNPTPPAPWWPGLSWRMASERNGRLHPVHHGGR